MGFLPDHPDLEQFELFTEERRESVCLVDYHEENGKRRYYCGVEFLYDAIPAVIKALQDAYVRNKPPYIDNTGRFLPFQLVKWLDPETSQELYGIVAGPLNDAFTIVDQIARSERKYVITDRLRQWYEVL